MRDRKRYIIGTLLVAVYAFFFTSGNLFYHSHYIDNNRIVHSHPFCNPNHTHNASQFAFIGLLDSESYRNADDTLIADDSTLYVSVANEPFAATLISSLYNHSFSLRAPPVCL